MPKLHGFNRQERQVSKLSAVKIRYAHKEDIHALSELLLHSFNHGLGQSHSQWLQSLLHLSIKADLMQRLRYPTQRYQCIVAVAPVSRHSSPSSVRSNVVIGAVEISVHRHNIWSSTQYPYLSNLAVQSQHRRQGVAYGLLQECESVARRWGFTDLYLHVRENNTAARHLYERCGYRIKRLDFDLGRLVLRQPQALFLAKRLETNTGER